MIKISSQINVIVILKKYCNYNLLRKVTRRLLLISFSFTMKKSDIFVPWYSLHFILILMVDDGLMMV